jgi:hypothetical protein
MTSKTLEQILTANPLSSLTGSEPIYTVSGGADAAFTTSLLIGRTLLPGNASYYVNSATGSDSNPGTALLPWKTLQHACDYTATTLDGGGNNLTINLVGAGPYTASVVQTWVGFLTVSIFGAGSSTTTINGLNFGEEAGSLIGSVVNLDSATFCDPSGGGGQGCIINYAVCNLQLGWINGDWKTLEQNNGAHIACRSPGAIISIAGTGAMSGNCNSFFEASNGGQVFNQATVTIDNTSNCVDGFTAASNGGYLQDTATYINAPASPTQKFFVGASGVIAVPSTGSGTIADVNHFPGDQPGIVEEGGTYCEQNTDGYLPLQNIATPTTGGTVNMQLLYPHQILTPSGTLATLTINLPPIFNIPNGSWPVNSVIAVISTTKTITALTVATTDGSTITGAPTTLAANSGFGMKYDQATNQWYPWVIGSGGTTSLINNSTPISGGSAGQLLVDNGGTLTENTTLTLSGGSFTAQTGGIGFVVPNGPSDYILMSIGGGATHGINFTNASQNYIFFLFETANGDTDAIQFASLSTQVMPLNQAGGFQPAEFSFIDPVYGWSWFRTGAGVTSIHSDGTVGALGFDNAAYQASQNPDVLLVRGGAAHLQFGYYDAASPIAQTLGVQNVVAGNANTAGVTWTMQGSLSNGSGAGGDIVLKTTQSTASSGVQNTALPALTLKGGTQSVVVGNAALATNATDGFLYIPTCAGTPTGTPTAMTGRIAMVYDTTNHQFWFYDGGWKQPKTPAGAAIVNWQ